MCDAKKAEKLKSEANERDEGELQRTGQPLCIYEIYNGAGLWPFLHHGSLYRALSVSTKSRSLRSDDVDAVGRLSILNESYYRDILLEMGGMFSIANRVDNVHKRPWIGFQSWRAAATKEIAGKDDILNAGSCKKRPYSNILEHLDYLFSNAIESNPEDYHALYNWALSELNIHIQTKAPAGEPSTAAAPPKVSIAVIGEGIPVSAPSTAPVSVPAPSVNPT
ncbi:hypothetical protein L2E82_14035 [Cichorium intybus]|uniref:Uncharacterized protein n=1 Tax=Cichorium intybus TaxID=13427 RepID=A0ACB9EZC3_CICIN|nr:hypothetical protein L2E82_14035 [Cichorium intybus]